MVGIVEEQRAAADGQGQQGQVQAGVGSRQRRQQAGSAHDAHGGRAGGDGQQHGDQPAQDQRREGELLGQMDDGITDLGAGQHLLEGAAAGNDHDDGGNRLEALAQRVAQLFGIAATGHHQGHDGEQHAQQHGDQGIAQKAGHMHGCRILGQQHLGDGVDQHQNGGQQGRQHAQGDAGLLAGSGFLGDGELVQQGLVGLGAHARGDEGAIQRAAENHGRNGGQKAVQHGRADRGLEGGDGGQWAGMGRNHAVHGRQCRDHGHADVDIGRALESGLAFQLARHAEDQRQHDHQADLEEHGDADDEGHQGHGPGDHAIGGVPENGFGDLLGDACIGQDLAQHGAQRDHDAYGAQRFARAVGQLLDDGFRIHAGGKADADRDDEQGQQRVQLDA